MTLLQATFLRDRSYKAVSLGHFFIDILNNSRSLLVALIAVSIGLTNAQVGIVLLLYNVGSSLSQPFFGVLADRYGPRKMVVGGLAWMIGLYSLAAVTSDWPALIALTIAGIGSGALHPAGTKVASETSAEARTQAAGVFFASGQTGLFLGPAVAGLLLTLFDQPGMLFLTGLATSGLYYAWRFVDNGLPAAAAAQLAAMGESRQAAGHTSSFPAERQPSQPWFSRLRRRLQAMPVGIVLPLTIVIMCSSTVGIAIINYAPKLFTEMGYQPLYVGVVTGLYMLGSAVGGIVGGTIADRRSRRLAIRIGLVGSILPFYFYIPAGDPWRFFLLLLAGFFAGMPHSVLVIMAQALMPGRRGFASGLILGLMFFSGALGTFALGWVADRIGLDIALQAMIVIPITASLVTLLLPDQETFRRVAAE